MGYSEMQRFILKYDSPYYLPHLLQGFMFVCWGNEYLFTRILNIQKETQ